MQCLLRELSGPRCNLAEHDYNASRSCWFFDYIFWTLDSESIISSLFCPTKSYPLSSLSSSRRPSSVGYDSSLPPDRCVGPPILSLNRASGGAALRPFCSRPGQYCEFRGRERLQSQLLQPHPVLGPSRRAIPRFHRRTRHASSQKLRNISRLMEPFYDGYDSI
jgi:hypothetical protein